MIKEIIVVEGRSDVSAVKRAVEAEVIATSGFGIAEETLELIKQASKSKGIIILTDPDYAGKKIRQIISREIENCKHAFIPRDKATKNGNIGVENASSEQIIKALKNARAEQVTKRAEFTLEDLLINRLTGNENASKRRNKVGQILNIGHCSSKQFLKRLNNYNVLREEFEEAVKLIEI